MLAGRRIKMTGGSGIWHGGAVTEGEDIVESLDTEGFVNLDATALVDRDSPIGDQGIRLYPRRPNYGLGRQRGAIGEPHRSRIHRLEKSRDPDVNTAALQFPRGVFAKRSRNLVQNPRLGLDKHPPLPALLWAWVVAQGVADQIGEPAHRLHACITAADEDEGEMGLGSIRIFFGVGLLELPQHMVAQGDRIFQRFEAE